MSAASRAVSYGDWRCTAHQWNLARLPGPSGHSATRTYQKPRRNKCPVIVTHPARRCIRRTPVEGTRGAEITGCRQSKERVTDRKNKMVGKGEGQIGGGRRESCVIGWGVGGVCVSPKWSSWLSKQKWTLGVNQNVQRETNLYNASYKMGESKLLVMSKQYTKPV